MAETVRELARMAPEAAELLLVDDGSQPPIDPATFGPLPFPLRLIRHETSQGVIPSRNEIAQACRTPYLLSCDDDSYPIDGSVSEAVGYLQAHPEIFGLSFPYVEGRARKPMNPSQRREPYPVRMFAACAFMCRTAGYRELGGYSPWLVKQNEERDLSYRALLHGWDIFHYPALTMYHDYTPVARNMDRQDFLTMRNETSLELLRIPWPVALVKRYMHLDIPPGTHRPSNGC
ncbi:MAG: glycosyltransferase [Verrucomicrobia bacterium]|nr:glycosyltransferase [Verrucomicrobiota bacterium]